MPPGRPKKLNNYEQAKVRKIRKMLTENNIHVFDRINDSALSQTVYIDTSGKIYISHEFYDASMKRIAKTVGEYINT